MFTWYSKYTTGNYKSVTGLPLHQLVNMWQWETLGGRKTRWQHYQCCPNARGFYMTSKVQCFWRGNRTALMGRQNKFCAKTLWPMTSYPHCEWTSLIVLPSGSLSAWVHLFRQFCWAARECRPYLQVLILLLKGQAKTDAGSYIEENCLNLKTK
jgi:hypothetical protein